MIKAWLHPLGLAAAILSALAIALPALQWASIPTDILSKALYASAAIALGLCKLSFFPRAARLMTEKRWLPALSLVIFSITLLWLSIESSAALLNKHARIHNQSSEQSHLEINEINQEIKNLQSLIKTDSESVFHNIRDRIHTHQNRIDNLKTKRQTLLNNKKSVTHFFSSRLQNIITAEYIIALCLHIGGILALLSITAWQPITQKKPAINRARTGSAKKTRKKKVTRKPVKTIKNSPAKKTEIEEAITRHD